MITLQSAADYVRSSKASKAFLALLASVRRLMNFTQERSNRLSRFVVITRAYAKGEQVSSIEQRFGCSRTTVLKYARMAGLPKRPKHSPVEIRAAVIRDYKAKMPIAEIARLHDVSPAYVSKVAREEGISRYRRR